VVPAWGQIQSAVTAHIDQRFAGLDYTYTNQLDAADTARWLAKDALSAVVPSTSWPQSESEIAAFSAAASSAAKAAWSGAQSYAWTLVA
jgi:sensor domain CHASE-containing protein